MAVMASWNGKTWGVSSQRIAALNGVSSSVELDTENSDDKAGSPATKTKALKLQSMSFDFDLASAVGGDARGEFESWTSLVGQYAPFYLALNRQGIYRLANVMGRNYLIQRAVILQHRHLSGISVGNMAYGIGLIGAQLICGGIVIRKEVLAFKVVKALALKGFIQQHAGSSCGLAGKQGLP